MTPPPNLGALTSLHNDAQGRLVAADAAGRSATWHHGSWQDTDEAAPVSYRSDTSQQTFDRLDASGKSGRIPAPASPINASSRCSAPAAITPAR
ncbi:Uncharacterised protein [Serratia rubidaea]|uniref:Uncharacterized protein n=1 Tax=Serratia rubidaea TaxID=61652 RepID=A0A3S4JTG5_SERRU|nr:Uncharacterised protein [Serratia rubidaea]